MGAETIFFIDEEFETGLDVHFTNELFDSIEKIDTSNFREILSDGLKKMAALLKVEDILIYYFNSYNKTRYIFSGKQYADGFSHTNEEGIITDFERLSETFTFLIKWLKTETEVKLSSLEEIPEEAFLERRYFENANIASLYLTKPQSSQKSNYAVFCYASTPRSWNKKFVERIGFYGKIITIILDKFFGLVELEKANKKIIEFSKSLQQENLVLKQQSTSFSIPGIISTDPEMQKILEKVKHVALTDSLVLIIGESGTGKELIARAIHDLSSRRNKPMVTVNCAAIPAALIESELFGREKGAYTGAMSRQIGRFEAANKSSIFLDEIGELPIETQSKLLRVLQFGEFQMLGSNTTHFVNARIIAATNKNLAEEIKRGNFREDLFYRINVFPIFLPPLRERKADIPSLVWEFVEEFSGKMGKRINEISRANMDKLVKYNWPGNLRELRNVIEYSMIMSKSRSLQVESHKLQNISETGGLTLQEMERDHILRILRKVNWKIRGKNGAAEILGLNESTLRFKMKKLGIIKETY